MNIKDLSSSKELDRKAMTEVRGGGTTTIVSNTGQSLNQSSFGGVASVVEGYQSQNVFNNAVDYTDLDVLKFAIGTSNVLV